MERTNEQTPIHNKTLFEDPCTSTRGTRHSEHSGRKVCDGVPPPQEPYHELHDRSGVRRQAAPLRPVCALRALKTVVVWMAPFASNRSPLAASTFSNFSIND